MYLSTNPHLKENCCSPHSSMLPVNPKSEPKSFKFLSALHSHLQTPDLSLNTQFVMVPIHSSHWVLWIFNSVIENVPWRKRGSLHNASCFDSESCSSTHMPHFPGLRVWQKYGHKNLTTIQGIWNHGGYWNSWVSDAIRIISEHNKIHTFLLCPRHWGRRKVWTCTIHNCWYLLWLPSTNWLALFPKVWSFPKLCTHPPLCSVSSWKIQYTPSTSLPKCQLQNFYLHLDFPSHLQSYEFNCSTSMT